MYIHHVFPSERYRPFLSVTSLLLASVFTNLITGEKKKKLIKKKKENKQTKKNKQKKNKYIKRKKQILNTHSSQKPC